ncbi:antitoxin VbhA family protein [Microbacterium sp.]|uniref:antitoxin VbhA family protein n=1 Tax=Microbacterium sp. TaxID=51671 RepID=UPI0035632524
MTEPEEQARLARLQEIREGMEELRIEALAERGGKTFTTEETLEFIRRHDLAADTIASSSLAGLEPDPAVLDRVQSYVEGEVAIEELIEQAKRRASAGS